MVHNSYFEVKNGSTKSMALPSFDDKKDIKKSQGCKV